MRYIDTSATTVEYTLKYRGPGACSSISNRLVVIPSPIRVAVPRAVHMDIAFIWRILVVNVDSKMDTVTPENSKFHFNQAGLELSIVQCNAGVQLASQYRSALTNVT